MENNFFSLEMDDKSFERLSAYVTREYGIKLPKSKKSMLESRLNKKVKALGMPAYAEFIEYIFSDPGKGDLFDVIDLITTNKTDFFRENSHFQFLTNKFLPAVSEQNIKIWSAGCSSGEEPYTIIMTLEEYRKRNPAINYKLWASDISLRVIQSAYNGVYNMDRLAAIPLEMKKKYFLRSKSNPSLAKVKLQHRNKIEFKRINLMNDQYGLSKADLDIIFCRNVLIYFEKTVQENVIRKLCSHLKPGGILFLGHSESIIGMDVPLKQIEPTTYQLV